MTSAIQRITAAVPSSRQIGNDLNAGSVSLQDADFTTDEYQVIPEQYALTIAVSALVTSDKTIKLPAGSATLDGFYIRIYNDSFFNLTVKPDSAVPIWNSGNGYGIDLPNKGTLVKLVYLHALGKWIIQEKTGGRVMIEGLVYQEDMSSLNAQQAGATAYPRSVDLTKRHISVAYGNLLQHHTDVSRFPPGCWKFDGTGDFAIVPSSPDWDIAANQNGCKTIAVWIKHLTDPTSSEEYIMIGNASSTLVWRIITYTSSKMLYFETYPAGEGQLTINAGGQDRIATDWNHIAVVFNGASVGFYLNGAQTGYDGTWTPLATLINEDLYIGAHRSGSNLFHGYMQDLHLSYNNPYNANPQPDNSDSFPVPVAPFEGVMK